MDRVEGPAHDPEAHAQWLVPVGVVRVVGGAVPGTCPRRTMRRARLAAVLRKLHVIAEQHDEDREGDDEVGDHRHRKLTRGFLRLGDKRDDPCRHAASLPAGPRLSAPPGGATQRVRRRRRSRPRQPRRAVDDDRPRRRGGWQSARRGPRRPPPPTDAPEADECAAPSTVGPATGVITVVRTGEEAATSSRIAASCTGSPCTTRGSSCSCSRRTIRPKTAGIADLDPVTGDQLAEHRGTEADDGGEPGLRQLIRRINRLSRSDQLSP